MSQAFDLFILFDLQTVPVISTFGCKKSVTSVGNIMPSHCTPYTKDWTMKCLKGIKIYNACEFS